MNRQLITGNDTLLMSDRSAVQPVLRLEPGPGNTRNSEGAFIELHDGRLMFAYTRFVAGCGGDHDAAEIAARFSTDGGMTWSSNDTTVVNNNAGLNVMCVSLCRLEEELLLFHLQKNALSDCKPVVRRSEDEGASWSGPAEIITDEIGYFILINDRIVVSTSGRLIAPVASHGLKWVSTTGSPGLSTCYLSDDGGYSWRRSRSTASIEGDPTGAGLQEPGIVQLHNDRLLMFNRTSLGSQYLCHSDDDGDTWSTAIPSEIRSPLSPASIKRIPSTGDLLLVWNDNYEPSHRGAGRRSPLVTAISTDEGRTWTHCRVVESDPHGHFCYTAIHFIPGKPERVLLSYCAGRVGSSAGNSQHNGLATLQVTSIEVPWLYAGDEE